MKIRNLTALVILLAFSMIGLTACSGQMSSPDGSSTQTQRTQTLTGALSADFESDTPRVIALDRQGQHHRASLEGDRFRLTVPKGDSYSLYVAGQNDRTPEEAVQIVFPRVDGTVDHTFAVRRTGESFDFGTVRPAGKLGSAQFSANAPGDSTSTTTSRQGLTPEEESDGETEGASGNEESETLTVEDEEADAENSCEKEDESDDESEENEEEDDTDDSDDEDEEDADDEDEATDEQSDDEDEEDAEEDEYDDDSESHGEPNSDDEVAVPETSPSSSFDDCDEDEENDERGDDTESDEDESE